MPRKSTKRGSAFAGSRKRRRPAPPSRWWTVEVDPRWHRVPVTAAVIGGLLAPGLFAQDEKKKPRKPKAPTAVESVMDRQIHNAIDAGDGDLVTRSLRQKVVEQPANAAARLALGAEYERQGAVELAIEHYRIAATQYGSEAAASRLAKALDELGESAQAVEVLVQFCSSHPSVSSSILSELGILEDEMNNLTTGEYYHQRALQAALVEAAPGQDVLHNNLGYNLIAQKRFSEAETQLRAALELNPRSETARNNLAYALGSAPAATTAQVNEAILQWQSLSGPAAAHNNLAAVYMEQGRYPEARHELERAIGFDSNAGAALKNLESLSALDGKPGKPAEVPVAALPTAPVVQAHKTNFLKRIFARKHHNDRQAAAGEVAAVTSKTSHRNQNSQ